MTFFKKRSFPVSAAVGEGCALALTALLCLPLAWATIRELLPEAAGGLCAAAAAGLSVMAVTAVIGRSRGREALATGCAIGGGYVLLAALLCALSGGKGAFGPWLGYLCAAVFAGGSAGAMVSVRQKTHKKRRR